MGVSSRHSILRAVCATFVMGLFATSASAQQPKVLAPHRPIAPKVDKPVPLPPKPGSIAGGPWMVDSNFQSTIYLKNVVETSPVMVTPVLHLSDGRRYLAPGSTA